MAGERAVRRLRVRGPDASLVRRAGLLVEDALRTASLPGDGPELVLVRKLRLAPFAAGASPQSVARRLEEGCRDLESVVVDADHADEQQLAAAPAVRFHDTLSAHLALTRRLCEGVRPAAWCWPLLVSRWRPGLDVLDSLRALALSLAVLPEAAAALPVWFAALVRRDLARVFLERLDVQDGARLSTAACAGSVSAPALPLAGTADDGPGKRSDADPARQWRVLLAWTLTQFGATDPRWSWVRAMAAVGDASSRTALARQEAALHPPGEQGECADSAGGAPSDMQGKGCEVPASSPAKTPAAPTGMAGRGVQAGHTHRAAAQRRENAARRSRRPLAPPRRSTRENEAADLAADIPAAGAAGLYQDRAGRARSAGTVQATSTATRVYDGEATVAGGLLFLVPVLDALGLPRWLRSHQDWAQAGLFPRIIGRLLSRLDLSDDDPMWRLAGGEGEGLPADFIVPLHWRDALFAGPFRVCGQGGRCVILDPSGRLALAVWTGREPAACMELPEVHEAGPRSVETTAERRSAISGADMPVDVLLCDAWLGAARRWLRRRVGIGLASLVNRRGRLTLTQTHIDVALALDQADLRIRRVGLDVDPGWVPWLGRVVRFHYAAWRERGER